MAFNLSAAGPTLIRYTLGIDHDDSKDHNKVRESNIVSMRTRCNGNLDIASQL